MADLKIPQEKSAPVEPAQKIEIDEDLVHRVSHELFGVITLIRAARDSMEDIGLEADHERDSLTTAESRAYALMAMADQKVRGILGEISPLA